MQNSGSPRGATVSRILYPVSSRGFTLLEFIVVISIISILAGLFLQRVPLNQELAEKAAMEQTAAAMQSALVMRYGSLLARGKANDNELRALASDNPIDWLQLKPRNYAGEYFDPAPQMIQPGNWYYDLKSRELVYVLDRTAYFTPGKSGKKLIRFHTRIVYESSAGRARPDKEVVAALFEPVESYHWME